MKGAKPKLDNVVPMKADTAPRPVPEPLELMSDGGKAVWQGLAPQLVRLGRLEPHFEHLFAAYCEAAADFVAFTSNIAMTGATYTVKTRNGLQQKKVADWGARQDAIATMTRIGALFGLTPVDERRLAVANQGDLFNDLLKQLNGDA